MIEREHLSSVKDRLSSGQPSISSIEYQTLQVSSNVVDSGVILDSSKIFIQLTDGAWVGRGDYDSCCFIRVPDLIDGFGLPGWTPADDDHAEVLNAREAAEDVMILPEPIANA